MMILSETNPSFNCLASKRYAEIGSPDVPNYQGEKKPEKSISIFRSILKTMMESNTSMDLEASWFDPNLVLAINVTEFNNIAKRVTLHINKKRIENFDSIIDLSARKYMKHLFPRIGSGCCGETANILEKILSGKVTEDENMVKCDMDSFIIELKKKTAVNHTEPWYCKASFGGHAFIIEFVDQQFTIHQSFFGSYILADNVAKNSFLDKNIFLENLKNLHSTDASGEERIKACKNLFSTFRIRKGGEIRYAFINGISTDLRTLEDRMNSLKTVFAHAWSDCQERKLGDFHFTQAAKSEPPEYLKDLDDVGINALCLGSHYNLTNDMFENITGATELQIDEEYHFKKFGPETAYTYLGKSGEKHLFKKV